MPLTLMNLLVSLNGLCQGSLCSSAPIFYWYIDLGLLDISNIDLPTKLKIYRNKWKHNHGGHALHKKNLGNSIKQRPKEVENRKIPLHWESDWVKSVRQKNSILWWFWLKKQYVLNCHQSPRLSSKQLSKTAPKKLTNILISLNPSHFTMASNLQI